MTLIENGDRVPAGRRPKFGISRYFLIVSTTWVFGLPCAVFTVVKRPVPALRPILDPFAI